MTTRARPTWPARGALLALLALLVVQAALGVREVVTRAAAVPLAERAACLGTDVAWRYRAQLGDAHPVLPLLRAHARPGTVIPLVHDDSPDALRLAAEFEGLLYPRTVRLMALPPAQRQSLPDPTGDVLLVLLDGDAAARAALERGGWRLLASDKHWQVWDSLPRRTVADTQAAHGAVRTADATRAAEAHRTPANIDPGSAPRMAAWRLALMVVLPLLAGALILASCRVRPRDEPVAFAGWAWMAGCTWIGLLQLAWLLLGGSLWALGPLSWTLLALVGPAALAAWTSRRRAAASSCADESPPRAARWERLLFAACVTFALAHVVDHLVLSGNRVVSVGDEGSIWGAKAKALWAADGFNARYGELAGQPVGIWHQDYPTLNPLLQVFAGQLAGRPLDFENRYPVLLFLPALVLALAGALRRCTRPAVAGLLLLVFITCRTTTEALKAMHSDVLLACGLLLMLEALRRWWSSMYASRDPDVARGWLALASVGATLLVFGKNEGQMLLFAAGLAGGIGWLVNGRRAVPAVPLRLAHAAWILLPLAVLFAHGTLNWRFGFTNDLLDVGDGSGLGTRIVKQGASQAGELFVLLGEYAFTAERETRLLVAAFLALALLFPLRMVLRRDAGTSAAAPGASACAWPDRSVGARTVLLAMAGILLIFLGTPHDVGWHVRWSLPRLMFQLLPVLVVCLGAAATGLLAASSGSDGRQGTASVR